MQETSLLPWLLLLAVIFVAVALVVVWLVFAGGSKRKAALSAVSARFGGKRSALFDTVSGRYGDASFALSLAPGRLFLSIRKRTSFSLSIYRERSFGRQISGKRSTGEVKITDASFDRDFLIFSNRPVQAVSFLRGRAKDDLLWFFRQGFDSFKVGANAVSVQKPDYAVENDLAPERVEEYLRRLSGVAGLA